MRGVSKPANTSRHGKEVLSCSIPAGPWLQSLAGIERVGDSRHYPRNAVLFNEGRVARGVYVLCTGSAKISICSADGRKLILRIARAGDVLGLYAGLTGRPYEATAELLVSSRVVFVSKQSLIEQITTQEAFGLGLIQILSRQFSEFVDHARLLRLSESAREKLARLILQWSRDFGELTAGGIRFKILLTQEEIAQIMGSSRETVTRLLGSFKRQQIIRITGGAMVIRNSAALASVAQLSQT